MGEFLNFFFHWGKYPNHSAKVLLFWIEKFALNHPPLNHLQAPLCYQGLLSVILLPLACPSAFWLWQYVCYDLHVDCSLLCLQPSSLPSSISSVTIQHVSPCVLICFRQKYHLLIAIHTYLFIFMYVHDFHLIIFIIAEDMRLLMPEYMWGQQSHKDRSVVNVSKIRNYKVAPIWLVCIC